MADLFRKYKSLFSTTSNSFNTGSDVEITLNSVTGLPTDTSITLTFDRVDSNGTELATMERITGKLSGTTFQVEARGVDNTSDQAHTTPVVEQILNAADWNALIDAFLINYNQDGSFKDITTENITACDVTVDNFTASERVTASDIELSSGVSADKILDEDTMSSDSATALATQQSIKAYVDPSSSSIASSATPTPTGSKFRNQLFITALAAAAAFGAPSGTPANGNMLLIRVLDNGTARALTWNAIYDGFYDDLPSTTVKGKTLYVLFVYNSEATKWELVAKQEEE